MVCWIIGEVQDGSGTLGEVRDRLGDPLGRPGWDGDPRVGPGWVEGPSGTSWTSCETHGDILYRLGTLG